MSTFESLRRACPICGLEIEIPLNATVRSPKRGVYIKVDLDPTPMREHVATHAEVTSHE